MVVKKTYPLLPLYGSCRVLTALTSTGEGPFASLGSLSSPFHAARLALAVSHVIWPKIASFFGMYDTGLYQGSP